MWPCIVDEVHWLNPMNPMEDCSNPENLYTFQSPGAALEHSNKHGHVPLGAREGQNNTAYKTH